MATKQLDLMVGDYVLATKWHDGDPLDHWYVGFFVGMLPKISGGRYEAADAEGNLARGNGFRRVKKISKERGRWLLENRHAIQNSGRSLWFWVRATMKHKSDNGGVGH